MAAIIGALRVDLGMNSAAFNKGVDEAQRRMAQMQKRFAKIGASISASGRRLSLGLTAPIVGLAAQSVRAQKAQEQAIAAVDAALASMGNQAGFTSKQLQDMAAQLQGKSLYGDEEILKKVTANLLTFGNIHDEVFTRAQQASIDLSARLGQDLQSSAVMLGKALNDPITGLTALTRVGVSFTEQQKDQIRTMQEAGDVAGAQKIILKELERQYRGQAEALAQTDSGKITQALNAIGDATEKIGAVILPVLADLAVKVQGIAERFSELSPETQKFVVIGGALAAALGPVLVVVGSLTTAIGALLPVIAAIVSPVGAAAAAIAVLGYGAFKLYQRWDDLVAKFPALGVAADAVKAVFNGLVVTLKNVAGFIGKQLKLEIEAITALFRGDWSAAISAGGEMFQNLADAVGPAISAVAKGLRDGVSTLAVAMAGLAAGAIAAFHEIFKNIVDRVPEIIGALIGAIAEAMKGLVAKMIEIGSQVVDGFVQGFKNKIKSAKAAVTGFGDNVAGWFKSKLGINSPSKVFARLSGFIVDGFIEGFTSRIQAARGTVEGFADSVKGWFKKVMGISSPSRVFADFGGNLVDGLVVGIDNNMARARSRAEALGQAVGEAARNGLDGALDSLLDRLARGDVAGGFKGFFSDLREGGAKAFAGLLKDAFDGGGLRAITGGLGKALAGVAGGIKGLFSGGGLGALGSIFSSAMPLIGAFNAVVELVKGFSSREVIGQGINIGVQDGQLAGEQFTTEKRTSFWGLFSREITKLTAFTPDQQKAFSARFAEIRDGVQKVYGLAGVEVSDALVEGVNFAIRKLDLRGLDEAQIREKIAGVFAEYGDALSQAIGGVSLDVAAAFAEIKTILEPAGQAFLGSFKDMALAAEDLAKIAGGVDALRQKVGTFASLFFTDQEKIKAASDQVASTFARLHLEVPKTREEFKRLVLAQDLMTKSGRETYDALLGIAPAFDAATRSMSDLNRQFDLSGGNFATEFDAKLAQIAKARGYGVTQSVFADAGAQEFGPLGVLRRGTDEQNGLLRRILDVFERWDVDGIEVRQ